jgi:ferric-chelate reductase
VSFSPNAYSILHLIAVQRRSIPYVYPTFIVWGLDRLLRLVRLVLFNHSYFGFSSGTTLDARPELLSEDLVRLTLRRPPHFRWSAAQTAYIILPSVSTLPFEAHPFTIASIDPESHNKPDEVDQKKGSEEGEGAAESYWKELVFLINVREGFTKRLSDIASRNEMVKAFLDGPYGSTPDLCRSDTCVLVAGKYFPHMQAIAALAQRLTSGGSGISHTLPLFLQIVKCVAITGHLPQSCSYYVLLQRRRKRQVPMRQASLRLGNPRCS